MESKKLEGELGWELKASKKVALDLPPNKTGCSWNTAVLAALDNGHRRDSRAFTVDEMHSTVTVSYEQTAGKQKLERFEGGPAEVLTASLNGEASLQIGLSTSLTQVDEEAVEINAVV